MAAASVATRDSASSGIDVKEVSPGAFELFAENVDMAPSTRFGIEILLEKVPTQVENGKVLAHSVLVDSGDDDSILHVVLEKARSIGESLPEEKRPRAIMELLRGTDGHPGYLHKAYGPEAGNLWRNPALDWWIKHNVGLLSGNDTEVPLSTLFEKGGYGVCRHFAAIAAVAGNAAGLESSLQTNTPHPYDPRPITNIRRTDTSEEKYLFETKNPYEVIKEGHMWVEYFVHDPQGNSALIPMCLSSRQVGDTPGNIQMFIDAHYVSVATNSIRISISSGPASMRWSYQGFGFLPGEPECKGTAALLSGDGYCGPLRLRVEPTFPNLRNDQVAVRVLSLEPVTCFQ
jgi:hypothetical protein